MQIRQISLRCCSGNQYGGLLKYCYLHSYVTMAMNQKNDVGLQKKSDFYQKRKEG